MLKLWLRQSRVYTGAVKADDHFAVHDNRRSSGGMQLHELIEGLAVVGDVFGRETHALLRQVIHRALARRSAGRVVDDDVLGHIKSPSERRDRNQKLG